MRESTKQTARYGWMVPDDEEAFGQFDSMELAAAAALSELGPGEKVLVGRCAPVEPADFVKPGWDFEIYLETLEERADDETLGIFDGPFFEIAGHKAEVEEAFGELLHSFVRSHLRGAGYWVLVDTQEILTGSTSSALVGAADPECPSCGGRGVVFCRACNAKVEASIKPGRSMTRGLLGLPPEEGKGGSDGGQG